MNMTRGSEYGRLGGLRCGEGGRMIYVCIGAVAKALRIALCILRLGAVPGMPCYSN